TGVGVLEDGRKLKKDFGVEVNGLVDCSPLAKEKALVPDDGQMIGLKALTRLVLQKELAKPKRVQCSNWETFPLTDAQLIYASTDAFVSLRIFQELDAMPSHTGHGGQLVAAAAAATAVSAVIVSGFEPFGNKTGHVAAAAASTVTVSVAAAKTARVPVPVAGGGGSLGEAVATVTATSSVAASVAAPVAVTQSGKVRRLRGVREKVQTERGGRRRGRKRRWGSWRQGSSRRKKEQRWKRRKQRRTRGSRCK
ncbi:hypothetical protein CLOM_g17921, partial [Closterium sp. NIES-68]